MEHVGINRRRCPHHLAVGQDHRHQLPGRLLTVPYEASYPRSPLLGQGHRDEQGPGLCLPLRGDQHPVRGEITHKEGQRDQEGGHYHGGDGAGHEDELSSHDSGATSLIPTPRTVRR